MSFVWLLLPSNETKEINGRRLLIDESECAKTGACSKHVSDVGCLCCCCCCCKPICRLITLSNAANGWRNEHQSWHMQRSINSYKSITWRVAPVTGDRILTMHDLAYRFCKSGINMNRLTSPYHSSFSCFESF